MPQKLQVPEGFEPDVPEGFEPDTPKPSHGASGSWTEPSLAQKVVNKVTPYLPKWRDAAQTTGMVVGGLAGAELGPPGAIVGAAAGSSIGESLYQLGQHLFGDAAPSSPQEAAEAQTQAVIAGGVGGAIPAAAQYHAEHPFIQGLRNTASKLSSKLTPSFLQTPAETFATRSIGTDPVMQKYIDTGLDEMKAAENVIGPIKDTFKARRALDLRSAGYNSVIDDEIVRPQADIVVPGSAKAMVEAQIKAIPEDMRLTKPADYKRLVREIRLRYSKDFTIGELNTLRSELAATQSPYYGKDISGQLTMDASARNIDIARGNISRELFYDSLDTYGLGGGKEARAINGRIGAMINWKDALRAKAGVSVAQKEPIQATFARKAGRAFSPLQTMQGTNRTVDENLELALKRWESQPKPIAPKLNDSTPVGTQWKEPQAGVKDTVKRDPITSQILMEQRDPSQLGPKQIGDNLFEYKGKLYGERPPVSDDIARNQAGEVLMEQKSGKKMAAPERAGSDLTYNGKTYYQVNMTEKQVARAKAMWEKGAPKPPKVGTQGNLPTVPGQIGEEGGIGNPKGQYKSAEEEFKNELAKRGLWRKGAPTQSKGQQQMSLPNNPIKVGTEPSPLFGITQQTSEGIPPGTKLAFKSKMLDGTQLYHYETPDGRVITLDRELTPQFVKTGLSKPPKRSGPATPPTKTESSGGPVAEVEGPAPSKSKKMVQPAGETGFRYSAKKKPTPPPKRTKKGE